MNVNVKCSKCGTEIGPLEVFPGGKCITCHAKTFVMPTAEEIVAGFAGSVNVPKAKRTRRSPARCADCGETGHSIGAMECQSPQNHE